MPAVIAPYGLIPINLIGGQVYAGSTRLFPINSASATMISFGDVVKLSSDGTVERDAGTTSAVPVGIFMGCTYTDATFGKVFRQSFPAATVAADIQAYVADDPDLLFKVAVCSSGSTTISYLTRAAVGANVAIVNNTGITATGSSRVAVLDSAAATSTLPLRIIDVNTESGNGTAGSYTEIIVKWNGVTGTVGGHAYLQPTGI